MCIYIYIYIFEVINLFGCWIMKSNFNKFEVEH